MPWICGACWGKVRWLTGPVCPRCGFAFPSPEALTHSPGHLCGNCRDKEPPFALARAAGAHEGALREAIHLLKYGRKHSLGKKLGRFLLPSAGALPTPEVVVPVPLHPSRLRHRGFNQSLLLADAVCRRLDVPLDHGALQRVRPTRPQVELTPEERKANIRGAFAVLRPERIEDKRVLLVDDVFTTGATVSECARVLRKAGAQEVVVATLSRSG
ncbi:MAG: ComF family protein [Nitrospirae bacterium]|nr:ComF family protein [Nitrospirota bacterium]